MEKRWAWVALGVLAAFVVGYAAGRLGGARPALPLPLESPTKARGPGVRPEAPPRRKAPARPEAPPGRRGEPPGRPQYVRGKPFPSAAGKKEPASRVLDAFAIRADRPLRLSWPLDVAPDVDGRMCLRGRQGANELKNLDDGRALYGFRVARPGAYRSFLSVRWLDDGVGDIDCNNSWFAAIDGGRKACVGDDKPGPVWHWVPGPRGFLLAGVHWYTVEIREDGALIDRIAVVREGAGPPCGPLEKLPLVSFSGFAGERSPTCPYSPVREVEIEALPTGSLVIGEGEGHGSEVTVLASFQGGEGGFRGEIGVSSPTAGGLRATGETSIRCSAEAPYARAVVRLEFRPRVPRRTHIVTVRVTPPAPPGKMRCVFRKDLFFLRPPAWAFLGPFPDASSGEGGLKDWPTKERLKVLAERKDFGPEKPAARREGPEEPEKEGIQWKLVEDGSCYDELGAVDLTRVYGPRENVYAYAVTWLRSGASFNHRLFLFQADDTGAMWINGHLVALMPMRLGKEHNKIWNSSPLHRGLNPVVVKVAQAKVYWGFRVDAEDWRAVHRPGGFMHWAEPSEWSEEAREPGIILRLLELEGVEP